MGISVPGWSGGGAPGAPVPAPLPTPIPGITTVYVTDSGNNRVQVFNSAGEFLRQFNTPARTTQPFKAPIAISVDRYGNHYVSDSGDVWVRSHRVSGIDDSNIDDSNGVAVSAWGSVYVADTSNNQVQVFNCEGQFIKDWGSRGNANGQFDAPAGIAVDVSRRVYVADTANNRVQVFRGIDVDESGRRYVSGEFLSKWGSKGSGDGEFSNPHAIAVDGSGKVYVADTGNNRVQVFSSDGVYLGQWGSFGDGDGQFSNPQGIAADYSGNVYVADTGNDRVQVFSVELGTPTPVPTTVRAIAPGTELIDFETPFLGDDDQQVISPYVDEATKVTFSALPRRGRNGVVGLVRNSATTACVEPPDSNQKLGTSQEPREKAQIGRSGFPISVTFPGPLAPPVRVSVEFQTGAEVPIHLKLFDSSGSEVASVSGIALPANGTCGLPGPQRARTTISATSQEPVTTVVMDVEGPFVYVIDDFEFSSK